MLKNLSMVPYCYLNCGERIILYHDGIKVNIVVCDISSVVRRMSPWENKGMGTVLIVSYFNSNYLQF